MSKISDAAKRSVRQHIALFRDPRWPHDDFPVPSTLDVLSGAEFVGGDVYADLKAVCLPLVAEDCPHKLPTELEISLSAAVAAPTTTAIRRIEQACDDILAFVEVGKSTVLAETARAIEDLHDRCNVWLAAIGSPEAARRCAMLCVRHVKSRPVTGYVDYISYGLMRSAIDYLATADALDGHDEDEVDVAVYLPEGRHVQISMTTHLARGFAHTLGLVFDVLDEPPVPAEPSLDDLAELNGIVSEDRAGIQPLPRIMEDTREDGETYSDPVEDLPTVPTAILVGDVSHVKKGQRGDDPVKEAEAIVWVALPLVTPPADLAAIRAELLADCPHGQAIIDRLLRPLASQAVVRNPPLLLVGEPGGGKTRLARRYGEVLGLQPAVYSMAGVTDSVSIGGVARGWSTGGFSAPVRELIRTRIANPILVIDEVDKIGTSRHNGNACDALINQLGVETAARYRDVYLQADVDLSHVQWILTANTLDTVPRPLLDRCVVLRLDEPGPEHLRQLATSILADVRADRGLDEAWVPPLDGIEWAALQEHWPGGSLRALRRLVEAAIDARDAGPLQ